MTSLSRARGDDKAPLSLYYSPAYVVAEHAFDTTRKARWIYESLTSNPIPGLSCRAPAAAAEADLKRVHDRAYIDAVRTGNPGWLARSLGFRWGPGVWYSACAHVGGLVAAARAARNSGCAGSLSSGQHHANRESGAGFCTFNGIALTAIDALRQGAKRVLIVDTDAHCAGGTHSLIAHEGSIQQLDLAVNGYDEYTPRTGCTLDIVIDADEYLPTLQARLAELEAKRLNFDLCIYYAGMDPFEGCDTGGLDGITFMTLEAREQLVFKWCERRHLPVAFGIGGGYVGERLSQQQLVELHRLTLLAAIGIDAAARETFSQDEVFQ